MEVIALGNLHTYNNNQENNKTCISNLYMVSTIVGTYSDSVNVYPKCIRFLPILRLHFFVVGKGSTLREF